MTVISFTSEPSATTTLPRRLVAALAVTLLALSMSASPSGAATVHVENSVTAYGSATDLGSPGTLDVWPIVGIAATPSGAGYWLAASDGGVFSYGDAAFHGSAADLALLEPIVGIAATPTGAGYWLVSADGGVFSYGDAAFHGSAGNLSLVAPIVGIAATPSGSGYWLAASDGGVFSYGDAAFHGSASGVSEVLTTALEADPDGDGYWLLRADGHIDGFAAAEVGDAEVPGDDLWPRHPAVDLAAARSDGYRIAHGAPLQLGIGAGDGAVRYVEELLADLGYWPGDIDTRFDDDTRQAVLAFQKANGLTIHGVVESETLTAFATASPAQALSNTGDVIEVDLDTGVLYMVENGQTLWALNAAVGSTATPTFQMAGRVLVVFDGTIVDTNGNIGHRPLFIRPDGTAVIGADDPIEPGETSDGDVLISRAAMNLIWAEGLASTDVTIWIHP